MEGFEADFTPDARYQEKQMKRFKMIKYMHNITKQKPEKMRNKKVKYDEDFAYGRKEKYRKIILFP